MAKSAVIFFVSAICLFSLLGLTQASEKPQFIVEGIVYCDPCRSAFKTNLSQPLAGNLNFFFIHFASYSFSNYSNSTKIKMKSLKT